MKNKAMLEGKELGQALAVAMAKKNVGPTELAAVFGVRPPSVSDWKARGCISKRHLPGLIDYFSDVVPLNHWGMKASTYNLIGGSQTHQVNEAQATWSTQLTSINNALDLIGKKLSGLDMEGRARIAPMFESFARSPGVIIKKDIAGLLDNPGPKSESEYKESLVQKTG